MSVLERCDRYDGTDMSPTNHVIVLKCPNASKTGCQAYRKQLKVNHTLEYIKTELRYSNSHKKG